LAWGVVVLAGGSLLLAASGVRARPPQENVLGKYKKERNEAVSFFINKLLGLEGGYRDV
jgi:hypothetical protein